MLLAFWQSKELADERVCKQRVQRLMGELLSVGTTGRRWLSTRSKEHRLSIAPDLVEHKFEATRPNQLCVANITYVPTREGFVFLSDVLDVYSRCIDGWSVSDNLKAVLVTSSLQLALHYRWPEDVIHQSAQGHQHTSINFSRRCQKEEARLMMGSLSDCYKMPIASHPLRL